MTEQENPYLLTPNEICLSGCTIPRKDLVLTCPYKEIRACSFYQAVLLVVKAQHDKMVRMIIGELEDIRCGATGDYLSGIELLMKKLWNNLEL